MQFILSRLGYLFRSTNGLVLVAMSLTAVGVALTAQVIGVPTLRLSGHYLAMATLGFNIVVHHVLVHWDQVTGGPSGLTGIPSLGVLGLTFQGEAQHHYLLWAAILLPTWGLNGDVLGCRFAFEELRRCCNEIRDHVGTRLYHIATFFKAFSLQPRGEHMVRVCLGTACHVRGAPRVLDEVKRQLDANLERQRRI
jgi:hypothetical protein